MELRLSRGMFSLTLFLSSCLVVSTLTVTTGRRSVDGDVRTLNGAGSLAAAGQRSATLFLLTGYKPSLPPLPAGPRVAPKAAEVVDGDDPPAVAELPPKPLPQTMLPRNMTADALKPPLGAAQVAPAPRQLVDVDVCRYFLWFSVVCSVALRAHSLCGKTRNMGQTRNQKYPSSNQWDHLKRDANVCSVPIFN